MTTAVFDPDSIVFEDIPDAPPRPPSKGREPVKWEEHLAPLQDTLLEKPARLWAYENKTGAMSRMTAVRSRLQDAAPQHNWEFKVRPVPNTEPQLHGVYAIYHGPYTPEEIRANAQARQERRDKLAATRQAATDDSSASATEDVAPESTEAPLTAKEKLAQAAKGRK